METPLSPLQPFAGVFDDFEGLVFSGSFVSWAVVNDVVHRLLMFTTWAFRCRIQPPDMHE